MRFNSRTSDMDNEGGISVGYVGVHAAYQAALAAAEIGRLDQFYCLSCREPRRAAYREAEIASRTAYTLNVRALCEVCAATTHKRVSLKRIAQFRAAVTLSGEQAQRRLKDTG